MARVDLQGALVVADGLLEVLGAVAADAVAVGGAQVVLGCGPLLGKGLACVYLQGALEVADGLLQVFGPVAADAVAVDVAQVVVGHRPIGGEVLARVHLQGALEVADGLLQILGALAADAVIVGEAQPDVEVGPLRPFVLGLLRGNCLFVGCDGFVLELACLCVVVQLAMDVGQVFAEEGDAGPVGSFGSLSFDRLRT